MMISGIEIPLWIFFIVGIVGILIIWKFIKFAIKILLVVIAFFLILFGLDFFNVFDQIQALLTSLI